LDVPDILKVVPVPSAVATVTVLDFAPIVVGLNVIVPVVQVPPEAIVELAVQVPKPTVKSVESELEKGVADRMTGPLEAVRVTLPVQETLVPSFVEGQVTVPLAAKVPKVGVPVTVAVGEPLLVVTVTVSVAALVELPKKVGVMRQVEPALAVVHPVAPLLASEKLEELLPAMVPTVEAQYVPVAVSVKPEQVALEP
jgi:hypothetical protein